MEDATGTKATDFSGNKNTGTLTNGPVWTTGKFGNGISFDGTDDYVDTGSDPSSVLKITGVMTISEWVKFNGTYNRVQAMVSNYNATTVNATYQFEFGRTANKLTWLQSGASVDATSVNSISDTKWHHLVVVRSGSTGAWTITFYIDGVLDSANSTSVNPGTAGNAFDLVLGKAGNHTASNQVLDGSLDDVRVYNRALSAAEVTTLYGARQQRLNAPDKNGLVGYWSLEDATGTKATDFSGQGNTGTLTNGPVWTTGKYGKAVSFDGTNDYVLEATAATTQMGSGNFTVSAWINTTISSSYATIVDKGFNGTLPYYYYLIHGTNGAIDFSINSSNNNGISDTERGTGLNDGNWHHVVMVADRTGANVVKIYTDGTQAGTNINASGMTGTINPSEKLRIGYTDTNQYPFPGKIDDVRIYNRALSAAEVSNLYGARQQRLNAPNKNGLVGYWSMEDATGTKATDFSGNNNTGTLTNGPVWTTGKYGKAVSFDGTNDYLSTNLSTAYSPLTVSLWLKATSPTTNQTFISKTSSGNSFLAWIGRNNNSVGQGTSGDGKVSFALDSGSFYKITSTSVLSANTWYYIVMQCGTAGLNLYINGALEANNATTNCHSNSTAFQFGNDNWSGGGEYFGGSLDDLRIYNRALTATEISNLYNTGR